MATTPGSRSSGRTRDGKEEAAPKAKSSKQSKPSAFDFATDDAATRKSVPRVAASAEGLAPSHQPTPDDKEPQYSEAMAWHLAKSEAGQIVTAFEIGLMQTYTAFERWATQVSNLVSGPDLTFNEIVILQMVRMQDRAKDAATVARLCNREDHANVLYNLRKLLSLNLVTKTKARAATLYSVTEEGHLWTERYGWIREQILLTDLKDETSFLLGLDRTTRRLHAMTGEYDAATRASSAVNPDKLF